MDDADVRSNRAAADWGGSGLAYLTGLPGGLPDFSRSAVLAEARRVADQIRRRSGVELDAAAILAGRAAMLGLTRGGDVSAGGATRLLRTRNGLCALTLSRPDDVDALPAMLEVDALPEDPWRALADWTIRRDGNDVVTRAGLLGIPAAVLGEARPNLAIVRRVGPQAGRPLAGLLVADLSSMWAGPLAARVLARAGATVVKVETASRPDGTRSGNREFFDWINSGKLSYVVDDIGDVRPLLAAADVVITSSRASALAQRGIGSAAADARPGRVWLRITGYGAEGDHANRVAFGDDAAVAGGLVGTSSDGPVFCGDAIADPLTGLTAALAVIESVHRGGGELIDVSMAAVAATYAALPLAPAAAKCPASPPSPMSPCAPAADLGTDNARVNELIFERSCATC